MPYEQIDALVKEIQNEKAKFNTPQAKIAKKAGLGVGDNGTPRINSAEDWKAYDKAVKEIQAENLKKGVKVNPDYCYSQLGSDADRKLNNNDWWKPDNDGSQSCAATALATMLSINYGKEVLPSSIEINSQSEIVSWENECAKVIWGNKNSLDQIEANLKNGKATVVYAGNHWVTVIGLNDPSGKVEESNLKVIDPWDGKIRPFTPGKNQLGTTIKECATEE